MARTPNLDRLAQQGVRFDRAYCQFPICNPSRVSLLLGRYPTTTETIDFAQPALLGRDWVTLPQHFRNQGYDVRLLGKIFHFNKDLMKDWYPGEEVPGDEYPPDWSAGEKWVLKSQDVHARMIADAGALGALSHALAAAEQLGQEPADMRPMCLVRCPTRKKKVPRRAPKGLRVDRRRAVRRRSRRIADALCRGGQTVLPGRRLLQAARAAGCTAAVLRPLPAGRNAAARATSRPCPPPVTPYRDFALRYNLDLFCEERVTQENAQQALAAYYACISFTDEKLGTVLDALEQLKLRDNTLIVLWGDHGWHLGEKGMWGKGTLFDVSARAPLIVVDPRKKTAGRSCPRTVEFVDIYPTLVDLCGLPMPPGLEGMSLVPWLDNPDAARDKPAYTWVAREDWLGVSVRTERWCYIRVGRRPARRGTLRSAGRPARTKQHRLGPRPRGHGRRAEGKAAGVRR